MEDDLDPPNGSILVLVECEQGSSSSLFRPGERGGEEGRAAVSISRRQQLSILRQVQVKGRERKSMYVCMYVCGQGIPLFFLMCVCMTVCMYVCIAYNMPVSL